MIQGRSVKIRNNLTEGARKGCFFVYVISCKGHSPRLLFKINDNYKNIHISF